MSETAIASAIPASVVFSLPPSPCVPLAFLRNRLAQAVTRDFRHTPAMQQSLDITLYHPGSARCWAQITAAWLPLSIEDIHGRPAVAATAVAVAALRMMMDVFNTSHPAR